ncbi:hypothetical protein IZU27_02730 [Treponema socranskii]|uniref:hypothetical protein n=1 Tax=Treponema socranskii TaxID=53419 RepID=UPI003D91F342
MWTFIKAVLLSTWLYAITIAVLVTGIVIAVMFAPVVWRIWIVLTCGAALLVLFIRMMLLKHDAANKDKAGFDKY